MSSEIAVDLACSSAAADPAASCLDWDLAEKVPQASVSEVDNAVVTVEFHRAVAFRSLGHSAAVKSE